MLLRSTRPAAARAAGACSAALLAAAVAVGAGGAGPAAGSDSGGEAPEPWFVDAAAELGLDFVHDPGVGGDYFVPESLGSGAALFDYDGDGDLDVYLVGGRDRLFARGADGRYTDVTAASGLGGAGYGMGVAVGDVDNDGDPDLYRTAYGRDALYENRGDGTFAEVTRAAGIDNPAWGASAVFFDADADGDLDLYVANYLDYDRRRDAATTCTDAAGRRDYCGPAGFAGVADLLYENRGDGTFADVSRAAGIAAAPGKGLGVAAADFDDDGDLDLYVANDGEANRLWVNRGDGTFEDRALALGAALDELGRAEAGMGVAVGDADGDGALDLYVTHLRGESDTLYRSAGDLGFVDATGAAGLAGPSLPWTGFGTGFADFDHDGDLDLAVVDGRVTRGPLLTAGRPPGYWDPYAEPARLLANDGAGRFRDVSARAGPGFTTPFNGRGLAVGDVDEDGDLDLLATAGGGAPRLLLNRVPDKGHWLLVRVVDAATGRVAAGSRVIAVAGGRRMVRVVAPGGSYLSSGDPRVHFGLGAATTVDELRVRSPLGDEVTLAGVAADRVLTVEVAATRPRPRTESH